MAKKSKAVESGQAEESPRGGATAEPNRCSAVSPTNSARCELPIGHDAHHVAPSAVGPDGVAVYRREWSEVWMDDEPASTAEPSIAEAPPEPVVPQMTSEHGVDFGEGRTEGYIVRVTDGPCEMGWTESNGVRVAVAGHTSEAVQAMVARLSASEVPGTARQVETLLARIAELEERLARQAASHREVRKRLLRKSRGGR